MCKVYTKTWFWNCFNIKLTYERKSNSSFTDISKRFRCWLHWLLLSWLRSQKWKFWINYISWSSLIYKTTSWFRFWFCWSNTLILYYFMYPSRDWLSSPFWPCDFSQLRASRLAPAVPLNWQSGPYRGYLSVKDRCVMFVVRFWDVAVTEIIDGNIHGFGNVLYPYLIRENPCSPPRMYALPGTFCPPFSNLYLYSDWASHLHRQFCSSEFVSDCSHTTDFQISRRQQPEVVYYLLPRRFYAAKNWLSLI